MWVEASIPSAAGGDGDDEASLGGGSLSRDQAVAALTDMFGEALVKALQDDQWKVRRAVACMVSGLAMPRVTHEYAAADCHKQTSVPQLAGWGVTQFCTIAAAQTRLDAMETVAGRSADPSVAASSGSMLVQAMSHVPSAGWGEKNFQVGRLCASCVVCGLFEGVLWGELGMEVGRWMREAWCAVTLRLIVLPQSSQPRAAGHGQAVRNLA